MKSLKILLFALFAGQAGAVVPADEQQRGNEIATEMDRVESGYLDYSANVTMHLVNRKGLKSVRQMRFKTRETEGDGDKSIVVFDEPRDIKGFAALTYAHKVGSDDQWMYLPQARRVKRISSVNQAGPFVGSEFAYEDIGSQELEQYSYRFVGENDHDGRKCLLVERYPEDQNSGYSKQLVWIDAERKIPLKIDYFDRRGDLLKTLTNYGYQLYQGRFWRPDRAEMINHQVGKKTIVEYSDYAFKSGVSDDDVSVNALKRLR